MTNETKARELAIKYCKDIDSSGNECYNIGCEIACNEAMEWKEKQMASRVKTFLKEIARICDITDENGYSIDERYLLAELEKSMKGE